MASDIPGRRNYLLHWRDFLAAADLLPDDPADLKTIESMVTVNYGRNRETYNERVANLFNAGMGITSSLSLHQDADTESLYPTEPFVRSTLKALDTFCWLLQQATVTRVGCEPLPHVAPHTVPWVLRPVQYPLASSFSNNTIGLLLRILADTCFLSENGNAYGLHPETANRYICHLRQRKAEIMATLFGIEPEGQVSPSEHFELLRQIRMDAQKEYGETQPSTTPESEAAAREGTKVSSWVPAAADWTVFAKIREASLSIENITQYGNVSRQPSDVPEQNLLMSGPSPLGPVAATRVITVPPAEQAGQRGSDADVLDPRSSTLGSTPRPTVNESAG